MPIIVLGALFSTVSLFVCAAVAVSELSNETIECDVIAPDKRGVAVAHRVKGNISNDITLAINDNKDKINQAATKSSSEYGYDYDYDYDYIQTRYTEIHAHTLVYGQNNCSPKQMIGSFE